MQTSEQGCRVYSQRRLGEHILAGSVSVEKQTLSCKCLGIGSYFEHFVYKLSTHIQTKEDFAKL